MSKCGILKDDREIVCMRRKCEARVEDPEACVYSKCEMSELHEEITCRLCNSCVCVPIKLGCGHSFCSSCVKCYIDCHNTCIVCGEVITVITQDCELQKKVEYVFPGYHKFRETMQFCEQKRMFFELSGLRSRLYSMREQWQSLKSEKDRVLQKVKSSFYSFYEICLDEVALKKQYITAFKAFQEQEKGCVNTARKYDPHTVSHSDLYNPYPDKKCCLESFIVILNESLCSGSDELARFHNEISSKGGSVNCLTCGEEINLLPPEPSPPVILPDYFSSPSPLEKNENNLTEFKSTKPKPKCFLKVSASHLPCHEIKSYISSTISSIYNKL